MTTTLPVPVRFELPGEQWTAVPPESLGVHNAAFLAVRRGTPGDYDPTITVSGGIRTGGVTLEHVADESLAKLRDQARDVELVKRGKYGSEQAPAVIQTLGAVIAYGGRSFDLRQLQVIYGLVDVQDASQMAVLIHTLTCTYAQYDEMAREFQRYLDTLEIQPGGVVRGAGDDGSGPA